MENAEVSKLDVIQAKAKQDNVNSEKIKIEVAYALPEQQIIVLLEVSPGITAQEAIEQSGLLVKFEEIDLDINAIGIYSKKIKLDQVLNDQDRVEIYRPLIADPKQVRKQRAAEGKIMRKGGGVIETKADAKSGTNTTVAAETKAEVTAVKPN